MEQKPPNTAKFPDLSGSGIVARLRWLLGSRESRREVDDTVGNGNGNGSGSSDPGVGKAAAVVAKRQEISALFNEQVVELWDESTSEPGRPKGGAVRVLVIGEQLYPKDPSVWGPPDIEGPLMQDDEYRKAVEFLSELEDARKSA